MGGRAVTYLDDLRRSTQSINPLGFSGFNVYNDAGQLVRAIAPEGDAVEYLYDARGNKTRECRIAKGRVTWSSLPDPKVAQCNATLGDLVSSVTYVEGPTLRMEQCVNLKTCNKPASIVDPNGHRTDYSWSGTHGGLLTEAQGLNPAGACAVAGGCPLITYGYAAFTGTDGAVFYRVTSKTEKIDAATSTVTTYAYDPANKFQLISRTIDSGGLNLRTCGRYDGVGNLVSMSDPRQGTCP
jgi:YD repeat-containing protein